MFNVVSTILRRSAALCAAALLVLAQPCQARDTITLCFERQDVLPWRTVDGKGLNFELLRQVATRADVKFEFVSMPWKRCLEQLKSNEVGGAFAVSFNPERLTLGEYPGGAQPDPSKRMHVDSYMLIRRKGSSVEWDGKAFHNLNGAIGFQLGYSVGDFLRSMNVAVDEGSQRASELARKLVAGRLAAAAVGGGDAAELMNGPMAAELEVLQVPLVEKPYYLILSHALVKANPQMAARIWKSVEEVRNSPAYKKRLREATEGGRH